MLYAPCPLPLPPCPSNFAFANTEGGKVILGVDDNGKISGIAVTAETEQRIVNEVKLGTYPQIIPDTKVYQIEGKSVLCVNINEYPVKPVSCKNRYYKRVKNSNHVLSLDEIVNLQQQSLNISYDSYLLNQDFSTLDSELLLHFMDKVNSRGRINLKDDLITNLVKLKLIRDGKPSLASMLLFGDHGYTIHLGRFKSEAAIIDDLIIKAPLILGLDEAMLFIKKHINLSFHFNGELERQEKWQYPLEVLRELLLNAVVHRDYKNTSDIIIKIFDDKIVFTNPGRIFGDLDIRSIERDDYVSSIRNKLLAEAFYLMGDIEKYGTGFIRIRQILNEYPDITWSIKEVGDFFRAEISTTPLKTPLKREEVSLSGLERKILSCLKKDKTISYDRIASHLSISRNTVKEYIGKLKKKGVIQRVGTPRSGYWEILSKSS